MSFLLNFFADFPTRRPVVFFSCVSYSLAPESGAVLLCDRLEERVWKPAGQPGGQRLRGGHPQDS